MDTISRISIAGIITVVVMMTFAAPGLPVSWIASTPDFLRDPALIASPDRSIRRSIDRTDDWTVECNTAILASVTIADVDGNGEQDIVLATYGLPPNPYWSGYVRIYDPRGNSLPGWPLYIAGAIPGTPAVGDVDNDGLAEIVAASWAGLHVLEANGNEMPGFPITAAFYESPALLDLDGDGDLEIVVASEQSMRVYHHDGSLYPGWPRNASQNFTAAAIADLNGDDIPEIVAGTYLAAGSPTGEIHAWDREGNVLPGFPFQTAGSVKAPPAIGDVDGDGEPEIVAGAWNQSEGSLDPLYVLNANGQLEPGWPRAASYNRLSSPSLGDLDGDGAQEIVVGGLQATPIYQNEVFVFRGNGSDFPGWPVVMNLSPAGNINSSPIIGDIDDDDTPEIVVKVIDHVVAYDINGEMALGFPLFLSDGGYSGTYSPSPAVGDFDNDGEPELVAAACYSTISLWDFSGNYDPECALWSQFRHDSLNTGSAFVDTSSAVAEQSPQPFWNVSHCGLTLYPNPASSGVSFNLPAGVSAPFRVTLFNVLGQKVTSMSIAPTSTGIASVSWRDRMFAPGVYFLKIDTNRESQVQRIVIRP